MKDTIRLSDIPLVQVERINTGFRYLDLAYGTTDFLGRSISGLPVGAVSLWSGSPGVGKTRAAIAVSISVNADGNRVMFVQVEVTASQFRGWTGNRIQHPDNYFVHTSRDLDTMLEAIMTFRPHLIVVDSLNMIDGYQSPTIIREISSRFREAVRDVGAHVIIIGHLNKEGRVKGNNDIEYLIDIQCSLVRFEETFTKKQLEQCTKDISTWFQLMFEKNRFGPTVANGCQNYVMFRHVDDGIRFVTSNFSNPVSGAQAVASPSSSAPQPKRKWWDKDIFGAFR